MSESDPHDPGGTPAPDAPAELAWTPGRVRRGPALIVLGLVGVISLGGFLLAALGSSPTSTRSAGSGEIGRTGISPAPIAGLFRVVANAGEPPSDVLGALRVPAGAVLVGHARQDAGISLYSGSIDLDVSSSLSSLTTFYRIELAHFAWHVSGPDATASGGGNAFYATRPSSDGFYWEAAVQIVPNHPSITPALNGDTTTTSCKLTITIFERDDAD